MKVLFATDGSPQADIALRMISKRKWPSGTQLRIVSVAHPFPLIADPLLLLGPALHAESLALEEKRAMRDVKAAAKRARDHARDLRVSTVIRTGSPKQQIVAEAERWGADLVVVGAHGHGVVSGFPLGSVAQAVAFHAPCSVEIVRPKSARRRKPRKGAPSP